MAKGRPIRSFDYVNKPYAAVRDALHEDVGAVLQSATQSAASRASKVAAALQVDIAGVTVGKEIAITIHDVEDRDGGPTGSPSTVISLEWEAATAPGLFPLMKGRLSAYALTPTETQLDFEGTYEPPLGPLGTVLDAVAGQRIAEASLHRFITDIAAHLRTEA